MNNLKTAGQVAINKLLKASSIRWFLDTNVLQSGFAETNFACFDRVSTTHEIATELEKSADEAKSGLRVLDAIEANDGIISEAWFESAPASHSLIMDCATSLAPSIRLRTFEVMHRDRIDENQAEEMAVQEIANEKEFFSSVLMLEAVEVGLVEASDAKLDASTRRSWFRYPAKRRKAFASGKYLQSDERLAGFALSNAILRDEPSCLLTNDSDFAAIMKQFSDNVIWVASVMDFATGREPVSWRKVVELYNARCKELDKFRRASWARSILRHIDDPSAEPLEPIVNGIFVCRPITGEIGIFSFSLQFIEFVRDFNYRSSRASLVRRGFWLPTQVCP